jgi:hypothetical protein
LRGFEGFCGFRRGFAFCRFTSGFQDFRALFSESFAGDRFGRRRFYGSGNDGDRFGCGDDGFGLGSGGLEMAFEIFGRDLIEGAGRNSRAGDAQFLGLGKDLLAFDT